MEERFYKSCHNKTLLEIMDIIDARIKSLRGMVKVQKKKGIHSVGNMADIYQGEIDELQRMAEYISGDRFVGAKISDTDRAIYDEIISKMKS